MWWGKFKGERMKYLVMVSLLVTSLFATNAFAKKRDCEARYSVDGGKTFSGFVNLGRVGGFLKNKRKQCLKKAKSVSNVKKGAKLPKVSASHCKSGLKVYIQYNVQGKRQDGVERVTIKPRKCNYKKRCAAYNQVFVSGKFK